MARQTLDTLSVTNPPQAAYVRGLIDGVEACKGDGGARAQVAALAVRGIVSFGGVEWDILTGTYGDPEARDWAMAQNAYGPARNLPGWTYVERFAITESEARALDGNR